MRFTPVARTFVGTLEVAEPVAAAFPLFSPIGEKAWVPGWNPELLYPPDAEWEPGLIFTTEGAVWVVASLDRAGYSVSYYRVEPERLVANVKVACRASAPDRTSVSVTYTFVGLTPAGNEIISAMSESEYAGKLIRWQNWIESRSSN